MNYDLLCKETIDICKTTGQFIREQVNQIKESDIEQKGKHDFVSYVDKTAEETLVNALHKIFPEAGFIAEEGTSTKRGERYNWVIDPLDGTTNFLHGIPCFSISVALVDRDEPVIGVVYEINLDECFSATKGGGAFLNGNPIRVSSQKNMEKALIATGFPYSDYSLLHKYLLIFEHLIRNASGVRRLGSAAADLAYVACGRFEFFYEYNLKHWDVAAGILLVTEAGGVVTDFSGGKKYLFGQEMLASNAAIYKEAAELMDKYFNN
jgi:myo-inositol-1(or 4)-monophosphatase